MAGKKFKQRLRGVFHAINSVITGEFLGKMSRYMGHVIVAAACLLSIMVAAYVMESLSIKLEYAKEELDETKLIYTQKNLELIGLGRLSTVEKLLKENNSKVGRPEKPATVIEE